MYSKKILLHIQILMLSASLMVGCASQSASIVPTNASVKTAQQTSEKPLIAKGKIMGLSKKAKTISIKVGKDTQIIKFTEQTKGIEHTQKGHSAIITYKIVGANKVATLIKPKLAKLPQGTSEMQPQELATIMSMSSELGNYVLVDARPANRFAAGHITNAISIPVAKFKEQAPNLLPEDKDKILVFYCGGPTCGMSTKTAGLAVKMGYKNVKVMLKGAPGWKKNGGTLIATDKFVQYGNIVLVDLRSPTDSAAGHIARSVNIPLAELSDAEDDFPTSKAAPIVFYGNSDEAEKAARIVQGWGYKAASVTEGVDSWTAAGNKLETGPASTEISWVRKLGKNEVGISEFSNIAQKGAPDKCILDVRNSEEITSGMFTGAINIPLDQLEERLTELNDGREMLIHCTTGARAEMAQAILKKATIKSRFLLATINCEDGGCEIED